MVWGCLMEAKGRFSSRRPSSHPLHGRNDMKTSKKRFSRQKHAHKQRKKGLSCHHAPPLYIWTFHPLQPARSGPVPRMRRAQVWSGTIRYALKRSASILVQPSSSAHHYRNTGEALPLEYLGSNKTGILLLCLISNGESVCT